jgi:hypothetical protein
MTKRVCRQLPSTAQLSLNLGARPMLPPTVAIPPEAVRTLADLLLEAMGGAPAVALREDGDESEN